jgi:DNA-binding NtrC family response regulator
VVRRPDLRALADALEALDALAAVPLVHEGELDGALVVPRGRRRSVLTLEELAALETLAARITPIVGLAGAVERSSRREADLMVQREKLEERVDALEDELAKSRAEASRTREGVGGPSAAPLVAYGPAMRAAVTRIDELAPLDAPVLFAFEPGVAAAPLVRRLHENGPRKMGPIVIADCANVRAEEAELALFGDELRHGTPGWLRLAAGGTLFLDRATALGTEVLRQLDEAIATRSARPSGFGSPYALDVRVVLGVHDDPAALVERSSMDPGLAERVRALRVEIPPLRARPEDLGSLVLFAIDRACRASGAATLGIAEDALAELASHDWPGNELELFALIERAVRRASPPRITRADVGSLVVRAPAAPLEGSLADIERRALETALARAGGNKSEAARLLGIARTTFLDKLKRAGIEVGDDRRSTRPPPPPERASDPPGSRKRTSAA